MEKLALESVFNAEMFVKFALAVGLVADNWVADGLHVDSNLVCSSRVELDLAEAVGAKFVGQDLFDFVVCASIFGGFCVADCHFLTVVGVAGDWCFNLAIFTFGFANYERSVDFLNCALAELCA